MAANGSGTGRREGRRPVLAEETHWKFPTSGEVAFTWDNDAKVAEESDRKMGRSGSEPDFK